MTINTTSITDILNAIGVPSGTTGTYSGDSGAVGISTAPLANFPPGTDVAFGILSSGLVANIETANSSGSQGTDLGSGGVSGDTATLSLTIPIPQDSIRPAAIGFDFTFLSEEYPEFVGSTFNDYFRAFLDGKNIALDTSGKEITVNNDFFKDGLIPSGTFFDGQTPPLTVRAGIDKNAQQVQLAFTLADVGDGIYDSAVFINAVELIYPQVVYLAFDAETAQIPIVGKSYTYQKPSAGLTDQQKQTVETSLDTLFDDFLVDFVTTKPMSGEYTTFYVGGSIENLPDEAKLYFKPNTLGRAEKIDIGNKDMSDFALIFSSHSYFSPGGTFDIGRLTQTLAHEGGHLFGLYHVEPNMELMYPYGESFRLSITNSLVDRAEINPATGVVQSVGATQNSYQELARNLGLDNQAIIVSEPSLFESIIKKIKVTLGIIDNTVYDAKLGIAMSDDALPTIIDLGTLNSNAEIEINAPFAQDFGAILFGASMPGGEYDIISGGSAFSGKNFDMIESYDDLLLPLSSTLNVFQDLNGSFTLIGQADIENVEGPVTNNPPIANNDFSAAKKNTPIQISFSALMANDSDPDNDSLTISNFTQPLHGMLLDNGNQSFTYTPLNDFTGVDSFTYSLSDGNQGKESAIVNIDVFGDLIDVYRFYNTATGTHFYTGSESEKNNIVTNPAGDPFLAKMNFEGPAYKAFGEELLQNTELYRFYNTSTGAHFFTASAAEKDNILINPGNDAFLAAMNFEGTAYYVLGQDGAHAVEVWRFYNTGTGVHFYTGSESEKDFIVANPNNDAFLAKLQLEGVGFWVPDQTWGT